MKIIFMCFLIITLTISCNSIVEEKKPASKTEILTEKNPPELSIPNWKELKIPTQPLEESYENICKRIIKEKESADSLNLFLERKLVEEIFPFWYGTPWDFNGYTNIPNQGKIACGYFVSTTLKHIGFNLNRFHLAQQLPIHEAKSISLDQPILEIEEPTFSDCLIRMKNDLVAGLYFIGLDASHVGFILKRNNQLFFIHSNYGSPAEVLIERADTSPILSSFQHFYLANISNNPSLLKFWKSDKAIPVVRG